MTDSGSGLLGVFGPWLEAYINYRNDHGYEFNDECTQALQVCLAELLSKRITTFTDEELFAQACMLHFRQTLLQDTKTFEFCDLGPSYSFPRGMRTHETPEQWEWRYMYEIAKFFTFKCSRFYWRIVLPWSPRLLGDWLTQRYMKQIQTVYIHPDRIPETERAYA